MDKIRQKLLIIKIKIKIKIINLN